MHSNINIEGLKVYLVISLSINELYYVNIVVRECDRICK